MRRSLNASAPVRAVTFDVGGTLIKPWPSVGHVYASVAARHGIRAPAKILNQQFTAAWKTRKNFAHSLSDWSDLVDSTFAGVVEIPPSKSFFNELYAEFTQPSAWRIFPDVLRCLQKLQQRGARLGAISNWDDRLRPLLRALDLTPWFETIVVSVEVGASKPDARVFARAAANLGLDPNEILHIGDRLAEDVAGAQSAGFQALLLDRRKSAPAPLTVRSLRNIPSLLAQQITGL